MKFADYLWYLAHKPLKFTKQAESESYKIFSVFGKILDEAKEKIFLVRRQALIATAKGKALDKHGSGRQLRRFAGESDEQYRKRLLAKYENARAAGTYKGIVKLLKSLGYDNAEVKPLYLEDSERWAEFYIFVDKKLMDELGNYEILMKEVKRIKQASSLPIYVLTHYSEFKIRTRYIEGLSTTAKETGTFACGGISNLKNIGHKKATTTNIQKYCIQALSNLKSVSKENKFINSGLKINSTINFGLQYVEIYSEPLICSKRLKFVRRVA
jgi:hypothetical protein